MTTTTATRPQIKHRYTGAVLFEGDAGMTMRQMLEKATFAMADLRGANLRSADLYGANMGGANLRGADLRDADLRGADLRGADLRGANLGNKKLIGARPFITIGPIGSRADYLHAFITNDGVMIRAGCFFDTLDVFRVAVDKTHGNTDHAKEYEMAILMIEAHAAIWTPAESTVTV